ncbi:MAG: zinc ribbon domain-containing protein [Oscillospiraceae bacterium]|nr:zinc ribbon domain-containing protein [Oscillospiraceae bacterium]
MFCKNCGTNNPDGMSVCASCGAPLSQAQPAMQQPAQFQQPGYQQPAYPPPANFGAPTAFPAASGAKRRLNLIGMLGAILAIISVFLPFLKVEILGFSESVSLFGAEGGSDWIFVVGIAALGLLLSLFGLNIGVIIMGLLEIGIGALEIHSLNDNLGSYASLVDKGMGCYLLFIGGAVMVIGGIVGIASKKR